MIIRKLINNNIVIVHDNKDGEIIVMGRGLGYKARIGDRIDPAKIEKTFILKNESRLNELLENIPDVYIGITESIVRYAEESCGMQIHDSVYLGLTDHIYFAVQRLAEGMQIDNPFLTEVRSFYQEEWKVGEYGRGQIAEVLGVEIPDEDVAYIAMHIIESRYAIQHRQMQDNLQLMQEILQLIEENYPISRDENTLSRQRLFAHVKYFVRRYLRDEENQVHDDLMEGVIPELFREESACMEKISVFLEGKYGRKMKKSEENYLILHLRNCKTL